MTPGAAWTLAAMFFRDSARGRRAIILSVSVPLWRRKSVEIPCLQADLGHSTAPKRPESLAETCEVIGARADFKLDRLYGDRGLLCCSWRLALCSTIAGCRRTT